ncbi:MAG: 2-keto-4-pentenoate hydratase, partial [Ilumatobacteraceae bacterium]
MPHLSDSDVATAAQALFQAELDNIPITPISSTYPNADVDDAYRISQAVTDLKVAAGRVIKGHKIGLTSKAMRVLTNATEPDYGTMFDNWFVMEGSVVPRSTMNRPLVEVELAFVLKEPLQGPAITIADVIRATDFVLPSIEIVDTRQAGRGPNTLIDSISDAAACGLVILGANPTKLNDIDVRNVGATLSINGDIEESGMARAVMGNPINAVAWLAN